MQPDDWKLRLEDILDCIGKIERYVSDMTLENFGADERTIDAVARNIEIIGEAARHVPPEVTQRHASVPWTEMRGMRNVLAHAYSEVSAVILWQTAVEDLPPLVPILRDILEQES